MLMKNKKGFSLIEMIVVIAIMAIVLGLGALGISTLTGQRVKTASKDIYNMYGSSQLVAMSKGDTLFGMAYVDGQVMVGTFYKSDKTSKTYSPVETKKIASSVDVYVKLSDGSIRYLGDPANNTASKTYVKGAFVEFDRNTGNTIGRSFKIKDDVTYNGGDVIFNPVNAGVMTTLYFFGDAKPDITHICIERSGDDIDICIVPLTGKFFYND